MSGIYRGVDGIYRGIGGICRGIGGIYRGIGGIYRGVGGIHRGVGGTCEAAAEVGHGRPFAPLSGSAMTLRRRTDARVLALHGGIGGRRRAEPRVVAAADAVAARRGRAAGRRARAGPGTRHGAVGGLTSVGLFFSVALPPEPD